MATTNRFTCQIHRSGPNLMLKGCAFQVLRTRQEEVDSEQQSDIGRLVWLVNSCSSAGITAAPSSAECSGVAVGPLRTSPNGKALSATSEEVGFSKSVVIRSAIWWHSTNLGDGGIVRRRQAQRCVSCTRV